MRFLFYKVVNEIMTRLNINFVVRNSEDRKVAIASKCNLLYLSLFVKKSDEITDENIFDLANQINGINDSKKYASGSRAIPPENRKEYNNIDSLDTELMQVRFKFFHSLIQKKGNIPSVVNVLTKMVSDSANVTDDMKAEILSSENDGIFQILREQFTGNEQEKSIQIFKILVYSLYYSDSRTPYDDLPCKVIIHPNFVDRQEIVSKLNDAFKENNIVYLCGIRGCGKTEISKKFISENNFYGILMLDYTDDILERMEQEQLFCIKAKESNQELIKKMDSDYLLVIENVTVKMSDKFINFINSCNCKVLVLSSWKPRNERLAVVGVDCFSEEQSYELMSRYTDRFERDKMLYIAKKLNYHALAMTVYAKAIEQSFLEYNEICNILRKSTISDRMEESVNYEDREATACEHIRKLFDFTFDRMTNDDKAVLRVMSLMTSSGIPIKQLHEFTGQRNANAVYCDLMPMGWINVNEDTDRTVTIHSIIRDIVIQKLKPDTENCNKLFSYLFDRDRMASFINEKIWFKKVFFSVLANIEIEQSIFDILLDAVFIFVNVGYVNEAKLILDRLYDKIEIFDEYSKDVLSLYEKYIDLYFYSNAEEILREHRDYYNEYYDMLNETIQIIVKSKAVSEDYCNYIDNLCAYLNAHIEKLVELSKNERRKYIIKKIYKRISDIEKLFQDVYTTLYDIKGFNELAISLERFHSNILYYRINFEIHHIKELNLFKKNIFMMWDMYIRQLANGKTYKSLIFVYDYYKFCRKYDRSYKEYEEECKAIYKRGNFEIYKYDKVKDIVEEFNLPHTEINSLEDE